MNADEYYVVNFIDERIIKAKSAKGAARLFVNSLEEAPGLDGSFITVTDCSGTRECFEVYEVVVFGLTVFKLTKVEYWLG